MQSGAAHRRESWCLRWPRRMAQPFLQAGGL